MDGGIVVRHHFHRVQPTAFGPVAFQQTGHHVHQCQVLADDPFNVGADDLDHDFPAVEKRGGMHLGDGGRGHGLAGKLRKQLRHRRTEGFFDNALGDVAGKRRYPVLQVFEGKRHVVG